MRLGSGRSEQAGRGGHVQRLVRPVVVVGVHPRVDRRLRRGQVGEGPAVIKQLAAQGLIPTFDLPGGRGRARLGQPGVMPFSRQIRSNSTSAGRGLVNRPVNMLPVVGQHLLGHPVDACRRERSQTARPVAPQHRRGDDHVPGMVIDAGDHLALPPIGQNDAADHVHLPQVHRDLTLPALVACAVPLCWGSTSPLRTSTRCTVAREGTTSTSRCASSNTIRRAPHRGWVRRSSHTSASTCAGIRPGLVCGRRDRSASPPIPSRS